MRISFTNWFMQLKQAALDRGYGQVAVDQFTHDDWRDIYNEGYAPKDAIDEDAWANSDPSEPSPE